MAKAQGIVLQVSLNAMLYDDYQMKEDTYNSKIFPEVEQFTESFSTISLNDALTARKGERNPNMN